jgi:proton-dependent oligopeptide transporter, POT family
MSIRLEKTDLQKQPRGLFLLAATQMAESFSYHGMRVLLVLFLTQHLLYTEGESCAIYGLYTALIELGACIGGYVADKYFGLKTAVLLGGISIAIGHLMLSLGGTNEFFFIGLGAIICGACLFRSNLKALLGLLYSSSDERRTPGFMLYHSASNLGGFVAAIMCGAIATIYGQQKGFGLAALGMTFSIGLFLLCKNSIKKLESSLEKPDRLLPGILLLGAMTLFIGYILSHFREFQSLLVLLTYAAFISILFLVRSRLNTSFLPACLLLALLIIYFFFDELNGSFLMLFCEHHVDREFFGLTIPSAFLAAANPLTIILLGPPLSYLLGRIKMPVSLQCATAFFCLTASLLILYLSTLGKPSSLSSIASFSAIALGELFLAPAIYSFFSEKAPKKAEGLFMGTVTMAFAVAKVSSGLVGKLCSPSDLTSLSVLFKTSSAFTGALCLALFAVALYHQKITTQKVPI